MRRPIQDDSSSAMSDARDDQTGFESEEASAGYAPPKLDLMASGFLVILSVTFWSYSM